MPGKTQTRMASAVSHDLASLSLFECPGLYSTKFPGPFSCSLRKLGNLLGRSQEAISQHCQQENFHTTVVPSEAFPPWTRRTSNASSRGVMYSVPWRSWKPSSAAMPLLSARMKLRSCHLEKSVWRTGTEKCFLETLNEKTQQIYDIYIYTYIWMYVCMYFVWCCVISCYVVVRYVLQRDVM